MAYWKAHPSEYDTIYGGGGCMLANLAQLFGLDRFVGILHDYAQDHWFGVTRTEDFKAAIDGGGDRRRGGVRSAVVLGHLAGGLSDVRPG